MYRRSRPSVTSRPAVPFRGLSVVSLASLILASGLLLGGGCRGKGAANSSPDGSPVLATVGGFPITGKNVEEKIRVTMGKLVESSMSNPDQVQVALTSLMDQMVWGRAAREAGYEKDPEVARKVALFAAEEMARKYLQDTIDKQAQMTEAEIQAFYKENSDHYKRTIRVAARHIQLSSRARAEQILAQVRGGSDFASLAREYSENALTRDLGGALGYVTSGQGAIGIGNDPVFTAAALALKPGQVSDVVEAGGAYHIILCEAREGGDALALDEIRDDIIRVAQPKKFSALYDETLDSLRRKYKAQIDERSFNAYLGINDAVGRLWTQLGRAGGASDSVYLANRIAFDFPRHELADDAQLLIAYTQAVGMKDRHSAELALKRFFNLYPNSPLRGSADWLLEHVHDAQIPARSYEELLTHAKR